MRHKETAFKAETQSECGRILVPNRGAERAGAGLLGPDDSKTTLPDVHRAGNADESGRREPFCVLATISRCLMVERPAMRELLVRVANLVGSAFGQPERIAVRVAFDGHEASTYGFDRRGGGLATEFTTAARKSGAIEVVDLGSVPHVEDAFLRAARALIETVAEMLAAHFDREAADQHRRRSETRLRQITDSMLDMVVQFDNQGVIQYVSPSSLSTLGYSAEAVLGYRPTEFSHDEDQQALECLIRAALDGGAAERLELRARKADGDYLWIEAVGNPLRDDSGRIAGGILAFRDITDRRRAEEAIRRSEAHFRSLIENASDLISVIDPGGTIHYESPSIERFTGFTAAEMVGRSVFEFIHPEDAARVVETLRISLADPGAPAMVRFRFRRRDGSYIVLESVGHVHAWDDPKLAIVVNSRNVTERESAEEQIRKLSRAVAQSPCMVVITDAGGDIEFINPKFTEVTGYQPEEVIGRNPRVLKSGVHPPEFYRALWATVTQGGTWVGELCNRKKSGELYWESSTISVVRDPAGRITHFLAIKNDITAHKREQACTELLHEVDLQILDGHDVDAIMGTICRRLAEIYELGLVWFGLKDVDGSVQVHAHTGTLAVCLETHQPRWDDAAGGQGPTGRAIRSGRIQVTDWKDPHCQPFRDWAHEVGQRSTMVIPLSVKGEVVGSLSVNSARENAFDDEIRRHISDVATRMSVALGRAHDLGRLRLQGVALSSAPNAIIITDRQGRVEWANESFCRLSGSSVQEIIGCTPAFLSSGEAGKWLRDTIRGQVLVVETWRGEFTQCHKDGHSYMVEQVITSLRDPQGEVTHFITIQEDITARKESEMRIEYLAHHDALTGLANRNIFQDYLTRALEQARRRRRMLALLILDLDRFKIVNDSLGHDAGDLLLKIVADRLRSCVRGTDLVARLGGDEFAIVQAEPDGTEGAASLARRVLDVLARPVVLAEREVHTTASIGIMLFPADDTGTEQFAKNADLAMYRAKSEGGNNFQFYSDWMNAGVQERLNLENALRAALAGQEFVLHYQPQVDLGTGRITDVEALVRWHHPERGLVMPSQFIPIAEDSGLIVPLGRWVLRQACAHCRAWRDAGLPSLRVHVNVSVAQFRRDDVISTVSEVLAENGLSPDGLGLEVTESLLASDLPATAETLRRLRRLGIQLSLDDFGTGYSSLSYLRRFPFDRLKVDKTFVRGLMTDLNDEAIVRAIIGMGHALGMRVVAEGVETAEQRRSLAAEGCDAIQGYLISHPLPAEQIAEFLEGYAAREPTAAE